MHYQFAQAGSYEDYASGRVFYSRAGQVAFPVRLASEVFQRCLAHWQELGGHGRCTLYDPCCGGAYHLSVLAFLHWAKIGAIYASDSAAEAVQLAQRNLSLLTAAGFSQREKEVADLSTTYGKTSHADALRSIQQFKQSVTDLMQTQPIQTAVFQANAFDSEALKSGLAGQKVDIVFADFPYGRGSQWHFDPDQPQNEPPAWLLLESLRPLLQATAVVAIAANKQTKIQHENFQRLERFQVGKRRLTLLHPL